MDTRDFMTVLETVGIPAAFAVAAGWMVYKLFNALIADVHKKLDKNRLYGTHSFRCTDRCR